MCVFDIALVTPILPVSASWSDISTLQQLHSLTIIPKGNTSTGIWKLVISDMVINGISWFLLESW